MKLLLLSVVILAVLFAFAAPSEGRTGPKILSKPPKAPAAPKIKSGSAYNPYYPYSTTYTPYYPYSTTYTGYPYSTTYSGYPYSTTYTTGTVKTGKIKTGKVSRSTGYPYATSYNPYGSYPYYTTSSYYPYSYTTSSYYPYSYTTGFSATGFSGTGFSGTGGSIGFGGAGSITLSINSCNFGGSNGQRGSYSVSWFGVPNGSTLRVYRNGNVAYSQTLSGAQGSLNLATSGSGNTYATVTSNGQTVATSNSAYQPQC